MSTKKTLKCKLIYVNSPNAKNAWEKVFEYLLYSKKSNNQNLANVILKHKKENNQSRSKI